MEGSMFNVGFFVRVLVSTIHIDLPIYFIYFRNTSKYFIKGLRVPAFFLLK
jgi:hypothetical protein